VNNNDYHRNSSVHYDNGYYGETNNNTQQGIRLSRDENGLGRVILESRAKRVVTGNIQRTLNTETQPTSKRSKRFAFGGGGDNDRFARTSRRFRARKITDCQTRWINGYFTHRSSASRCGRKSQRMRRKFGRNDAKTRGKF